MTDVPLKLVAPSTEHLLVRGALERVLATEGKDVPIDQILAIVAHFLGQLIAVQDHRIYTTELIWTLIERNIRTGNAEMVQSMLSQRNPQEKPN
jgi:hypothetical protein